MKDKVFGVLQRVGRSFMLPIALLPVAGLLLGIGSSFTNETMLETYGLTGLIHQGTVLYTILDIMNQCGSAVFNNLALLFAMGVAIGMAKKEKEVAALSGAIAYLVMNTAISAMINAAGGVEAMAPNTTTSMLGITTLQMGVFGGIIVGLGVAALHNRFYKIQLPQVLSFFGGTRFVPIVSTAVYLLVGIAMFYVWPVVQTGIGMLGNLVISSGYAGTFIYGLIERALIPFGLHHVFYMPFWQTAVGGTAIIDGVTVQGAQNIFFAELASRATTEFSVDATRFMTGKFVFMIFGLPGAALAMYRTARPQKRKVVAGLLLSAALTSMLTGITEPLEFTFLFIAPVMYAVHCVYAGLAYMLMHILDVCVGMTFSGGLIDLTLFGIMQGNGKTHWLWIVAVGAVYFVLYYFTFSVMIRKMDLKTPGREADTEEPKLYNRADFKEKTGVGPDGASGPRPRTRSRPSSCGGWAARRTSPTWTAAPPACASPWRTRPGSATACSSRAALPAWSTRATASRSSTGRRWRSSSRTWWTLWRPRPPTRRMPRPPRRRPLAPAPAAKPAEKPPAPPDCSPRRLGAHLAGTVVPDGPGAGRGLCQLRPGRGRRH